MICVFFLLFVYENDVNVPSKSNTNPDPDPLVWGMDPRIQIRIWIHTKTSWIRNTGCSQPPSGTKAVAFTIFTCLSASFFTLCSLPLQKT